MIGTQTNKNGKAMVAKDICFVNLFRRCLGPESRRRNLVLTPDGKEAAFFGGDGYASSSEEDKEELVTSLETSLKNEELRADISMRLSPSNLQLRVLPLNREQAWEKLEDTLLIHLNGRTEYLEHFRNLHHNAGLTQSNILCSMAYLASSRPRRRDESEYYEHISAVSAYLSIGRAKREVKLSVLQTLVSCLSPVEATWQTQDNVIECTLDFLTKRNEEWDLMEHSETMLIWELRAMCLRQLDREQQRVALVANTGDTAAVMISAGAKLVEEGMARSVPVISDHIETAGEHIKGWVNTDVYPLIMDRDAVVAMAYSDAAKRASEGAKDSTLKALHGIREASTRGIKMMTNKLNEGQLTEKLAPESLEMLRATGKIGMATLGAAAVVGEALVESTRSLVQITAVVAADVVEHKYGTSAGQVVSDAGETAGNILRTIGNVAMLESKIIAKSMAKSAGKEQVNSEVAKAKDTLQLLEKQVARVFNQTLGYTQNGKAIKQLGFTAQPLGKSAQPRTNNVETREHENILAGTNPIATTGTHPMEKSKSSTRRGSNGSVGATSETVSSSTSSTSSSSSQTSTTVAESSGNKFRVPRRSSASSTGSHRSNSSSVSRHSRRGSGSRRSRVPLTSDTLSCRSSRRSLESKRRGSHFNRKRVPLTPDMDCRKRTTLAPNMERSAEVAGRKRLPLVPDKSSVGKIANEKENHFSLASSARKRSGTLRPNEGHNCTTAISAQA